MPYSHVEFEGFDYVALDSPNAFCGPKELADCFEKVPKPLGDGLQYPFCRESVRNLLGLSLSTSLLEEEGRFPRFRVILGDSNSDCVPFRPVAFFETPVVIAVTNDLRKLAPAVSNHALSLWVAEFCTPNGLELRCLGILARDPHVWLGRTESQFGQSAIGGMNWALISVEAPGQIRLGGFGLAYQLLLRAGRIRPVTDFKYALNRALPGLASAFDERIRTANQDLAKHVIGHCGQSLYDMISALLSAVFEKRHGGAFLVVNETELNAQEIRRKYDFEGGTEVSLDVGSRFVDLHLESASIWKCEIGDDGAKRVIQAARQWQSARARLDGAIRCAAALTSVDGCVVMDRTLKIHLFGAKIKAGSPKLPSKALEDSELNSLGTRHNSAHRFCCCYPDSLAIVISQDSELRFFFSDKDGCDAWGSMEPWHLGLVH